MIRRAGVGDRSDRARNTCRRASLPDLQPTAARDEPLGKRFARLVAPFAGFHLSGCVARALLLDAAYLRQANAPRWPSSGPGRGFARSPGPLTVRVTPVEFPGRTDSPEVLVGRHGL